jgi:hypothetical protein
MTQTPALRRVRAGMCTYPVHGDDDEKHNMMEHAGHHADIPAVLEIIQLVGKDEDVIEVQQVQAVVRHSRVQPPLGCNALRKQWRRRIGGEEGGEQTQITAA